MGSEQLDGADSIQSWLITALGTEIVLGGKSLIESKPQLLLLLGITNHDRQPV